MSAIAQSTVSVPKLHISGGLFGHFLEPNGFQIGLLPGAKLLQVSGVPHSHVSAFLTANGLKLVAIEERIPDPDLQLRIWTPAWRVDQIGGLPRDTLWAGISTAAFQAGDTALSELARKISFSLQAADIRLRDLSDAYERQHISAIKSAKKIGNRFRNLAIYDLHLACHSVLSEMSSARDYLAAVAARSIGAPSKIESLARLTDWLKNREPERLHPAVAELLAATDQDSGGWLSDLGEYRNFFLHRAPIGTSEISANVLLERIAPEWGETHLLRLYIPAEPRRADSTEVCDAMDRLVALRGKLDELSDRIARTTGYRPLMHVFREGVDGLMELVDYKPSDDQ